MGHFQILSPFRKNLPSVFSHLKCTRLVFCLLLLQIAQRKIHENLSSLENINRQYRRLAREGRTDASGSLKTMMQDANDRWDMLQGQMSTILRQLKHSSSIREDFRKTKEALLSWLTEIDMQLTNLDQLSSMDAQTKLREMDVSEIFFSQREQTRRSIEILG